MLLPIQTYINYKGMHFKINYRKGTYMQKNVEINKIIE